MGYPKIAQRFGAGTLPGGGWVAEEKVHGAHFALVSDGGTTRPAGRRGVLEEERFEAFFGVTRLWPVLATAAAAAARAVQGESVLYGELAGGGYPHPDVASVDGVGPVQTGVWYSPDLVWLTFDGAVRSGSGVRWLGRDELGALSSRSGSPSCPWSGGGGGRRCSNCRWTSTPWCRGRWGCPSWPGIGPRAMW